jgi:hypothetical protein
MPKKHFFSRFRKKGDNSKSKPDVSPLLETVSPLEPGSMPVFPLDDDTWGMIFADWYYWFGNKIKNLNEWIPYHWLYDYESLDPVDKRILVEQENLKILRRNLGRLRQQRERVIRVNHHDDVVRVGQKELICKNWQDNEVSHLEQQRDRSIGIVPGVSVNSEYSKVKGWTINTGDSNFRGISSLCDDLQCTKLSTTPCPEMVNVISTQVESMNDYSSESKYSQHKMSASYQNQINQLEKDVRTCWDENDRINEKINTNIRECSTRLEQCLEQCMEPKEMQVAERFNRPEYSAKYNRREDSFNEPPHRIDPDEWNGMRFIGHGPLLEQVFNVLSVPLNLWDPNSYLYRGRPPFFILRYVYALAATYIYCRIIGAIFSLVQYSVQYLPEPPDRSEKLEKRKDKEKRKRDKEKDKRNSKNKKQDPDNFTIDVGELLSKVVKFSRGGALDSLSTSERQAALHSIDPIFILVRLENIRIKNEAVLNPYLKTKIFLKKSIQFVGEPIRSSYKFVKLSNKSSFAYVGLILLTFNKPTTRLTGSSIPVIQRVYSLDDTSKIPESLKSTTEIQVSDRTLSFSPLSKSKTVNKNKVSRTTLKGLKRAKIMKFSDLPRLPISDSGDIVEEYITKSDFRIPIR